ncbi:MAG: hypothetical protein FWH14_03640 [Oscillospiraceae bacterium]|nr:hypothetical protein [Oscillospiraceae bacterium]
MTEGGHPYRPPRRCGGTPPQRGMGLEIIVGYAPPCIPWITTGAGVFLGSPFGRAVGGNAD